MQRWLIALAIGVCMVLFAASGALGAEVYVEYLPNGTWEINDWVDGDASATIIGLEFPIEKWKLGFEFATGDLDAPNGGNFTDIKAYEFKGGYQVVSKENVKVDLTASYLKFDNDDFDTNADGVLLGADASFQLASKVSLDGSIGYSISGNTEFYGYDVDATLWRGKVKLNYDFTKNLTGAIGYRYYNIENDYDDEFELRGWFAGVSYKF